MSAIFADVTFPSAISRYLVSNRGAWRQGRSYTTPFPSAISRYLVSNPTRKTPPLTSGGGNGLHTPRRIDHIPTFASLNHDKNTRSNHYTPNAGIELSETTPLSAPTLALFMSHNCPAEFVGVIIYLSFQLRVGPAGLALPYDDQAVVVVVHELFDLFDQCV